MLVNERGWFFSERDKGFVRLFELNLTGRWDYSFVPGGAFLDYDMLAPALSVRVL